MSETGIALRRISSGRPASDEEEGMASGPSTPGGSEMKFERRDTNLAQRFLRKGKRKIGVKESLVAIAFSSWLNLLLVFIPIAWVAHFNHPKFSDTVTFILCFLSIVPLEKLFDYGGEQMAFYLGADLGDLLVVTLNNTVEATLAIILLKKCELKLLQSTIMGVVLLHLLLIPGVAFVTGGARVMEQDLHPHLTQLNHTLLTIGVMTLLLPAAFFAALDRGILPTGADAAESVLDDTLRGVLLQMSRGLAVILLAVYVCSRIFLHNPPGKGNSELAQHKLAPLELKERAKEFEENDPEVNQWVCLGMLAVTIAIMAATAEWLVDSIDFVKDAGVQPEWFGLILLPMVSFSGDGFIAIMFFIRSCIQYLRGQPYPPATLANARPIDLSIQFIMFWMPFIVLLGWWSDRPMSLLFDLFEVALIISSCFIVNYVTADSKTNWAEGFAMLAFYVMIALCSWFYKGQEQLLYLVQCKSVEEVVAEVVSGVSLEVAAG